MDYVERSRRRCVKAIAVDEFDVWCVPGKGDAGLGDESGLAFDGDDVARGDEARDEGCRVATAATNVEDVHAGAEAKERQHAPHHAGLRNGLAAADGEWGVVVSRAAQAGGDEIMAWERRHGCDDALIGSLSQVVADHARPPSLIGGQIAQGRRLVHASTVGTGRDNIAIQRAARVPPGSATRVWALPSPKRSRSPRSCG